MAGRYSPKLRLCLQIAGLNAVEEHLSKLIVEAKAVESERQSERQQQRAVLVGIDTEW